MAKGKSSSASKGGTGGGSKSKGSGKKGGGESAKLVEYLGRAAGKERHIEAALAAHLVMTTRPSYHGRLERHLKDTKVRAEKVERRLEQLGGSTRSVALPGSEMMGEVRDAAKMVAERAVSLAKGPLEAMRDDREAETLLENARVEYADASEQVATYTVVRALAKAASDKPSDKLAKDFRDEHADMAEFVEKLIPKLSSAVVKTEARATGQSGARSSTGSDGGAKGSSAGGGPGSAARQSSGSSSRARSGGRTRKASSGARRSASSGTAQRSASSGGGARARSSGSRGGSSKAKSPAGGSSGNRSSGGSRKRQKAGTGG